MTIVEKNDVDISRLFAWSKKFNVLTQDGEELGTFYLRLLGDADSSRARVFSLRRSAELRGKLRDTNSDEYVSTFADVDEVEKERLAQLLVVFSIRELSQRITKEVKLKVPKQPKSDASTEAFEKYQAEVDSYPARREAEIRKQLEIESKKLLEKFMAMERDELRKKVISAMTNELCENELLKAFREMAAYLGSYKDETLKERLFEDFEQFANLPTYIKNQFVSEYRMLELNGDDLKKLQVATL